MARNERVLAKLARDAVNEATLSDSAVQHPTAAASLFSRLPFSFSCESRSCILQLTRYLSDANTVDLVYDKIMERANNDRMPQKLVTARCITLLKAQLAERWRGSC